MAANTVPIFGEAPIAGWTTSAVLTANTTKDGSSGTTYDIVTAGVDGAYITKLIIRPRGTNIASVVRIFLNNGSATTTAANNALIAEVTMPSTTNSETAAINGVEVPLNIAIPASYKLFATTGTTVAGGYTITALGANY